MLPAGLSVVTASCSDGRLSEYTVEVACRRSIASIDLIDLEADVRENGVGLGLREEGGSNPPTDVPVVSCNEVLLKEDERMTRAEGGGPKDAGDAAMVVDEVLR